ncbi:MAG: hypothetical protein ABIZ34_10485, partial [Candidatus Limnocylindrales bacterium]
MRRFARRAAVVAAGFCGGGGSFGITPALAHQLPRQALEAIAATATLIAAAADGKDLVDDVCARHRL